MKLIFGADNRQSILKVDTIRFDGCDKACLKYSEIYNTFAKSQERGE